MRLHSFAFAGYRAFPGRAPSSQQRPLQRVPLAPLTVIFGKNNSGKTSVGRALQQTLLAASSYGSDPFPLRWRDQVYAQSFTDLLHAQRFFSPLDVKLQIEMADSTSHEIEAQLVCEKDSSSTPTHRIFRCDADDAQGPFSGLLPEKGPLFEQIRKEAGDLLDASCHIGPLRDPVQYSYEIDSTAEWERCPETNADFARLLFDDSELRAKVSAWTSTYLEGWTVDPQLTLKVGSLNGRKGGLDINLCYAGQGIQQVLPVVGLCAWRALDRSQKSFIDFIEQPELHLHDAAHAALGELLVEATTSRRGVMVVETHSEALILRLRRKIAEGTIGPEDVSLVYVSDDEDGSVVQPIAILPDGEVSLWPQGIFSESFLEVQGIRAAQRRREQKK